MTDLSPLLNLEICFLAEWHNTGGVLLLGYEMYRLLSTKRVLSNTKRSDRRRTVAAAAAAAATSGSSGSSSTSGVNTETTSNVIDLEKEDFNKELLKGQFEYSCFWKSTLYFNKYFVLHCCH